MCLEYFFLFKQKRAYEMRISDWSSDVCFPGQQNFARAFNYTLESLREIYEALPDEWQFLVEYKPYEPNFYSTVIQDWGTSHLFCTKLGEKANVLVDLGHHQTGRAKWRERGCTYV